MFQARDHSEEKPSEAEMCPYSSKGLRCQRQEVTAVKSCAWHERPEDGGRKGPELRSSETWGGVSPQLEDSVRGQDVP